MADEKRTASPMDRVWDFFISVKLAIVTLIILAVASTFGTIVEQNQPMTGSFGAGGFSGVHTFR